MIIKLPDKNDIKAIEYLNNIQKDFKLPSLEHDIISRIIYDDRNMPVAYGTVKRMAEAIMLVDPHAPSISRAKAMRELMKYAEYGAARENCQQLHCFVQDERVASLLEDHFNFIRTRDIVLAKDL